MNKSTLMAITTAAMTAFAANSMLCRTALRPDGGTAIDPAAFTLLRLASGALVLGVWLAWKPREQREQKKPWGRAAKPSKAETLEKTHRSRWLGAAALVVYAAGFSWAYVKLDTGTGALLLFGAVQATMIGGGFVRGQGLSGREWSGLMVALLGLGYLVWPGVSAPPTGSAAVMVLAGIGWGVYSLLGRGVADPTAATSGNFARAVVLMLPVAAVLWWFQTPAWMGDVSGAAALDQAATGLLAGGLLTGVLLAVVSGAAASGAAYAVWYAAVRQLRPTTASAVQLSVPVIAAAAGVVLLNEALSLRLVGASALVLGGLAWVITSPDRSHDR